MNANEIALKWLNENVDLENLKMNLFKRLSDGDVGFNEQKTEKGMFLYDVITDASGRWFLVDLAEIFRLISYEEKQKHYEKGLYQGVYEKEIQEVEKEIIAILNEKIDCNGQFYFAWSTPYFENTDNYYGICYKEAV